jgi:hypothetical protein
MKKNLALVLTIFCYFISFASFTQWTKKLSLTGNETFSQVSAPNDKIVLTLTNKLNIYLTTNGGNTWTHYATTGIAEEVTIEWIFAFDSSTALLAVNTNFTGHGPGIIYRTTNGGHIWTQVLSHFGNCDFKIGMADERKGLLVINFNNMGGNSKQELLGTLNGGVTWSKNFIVDPTSFYVVSGFFVKGPEAWLQANDSLYYSTSLGSSWSGEKLPPNVGYNHMQFENRSYVIANSNALIDLYLRRPPQKRWQNIKDPTNVSGAVTGLVLNGKECWLSEALDAIQNFYSNDSCKTFTPVVVDPQSAFLILQKSWRGNKIWSSTSNKLYVNLPRMTSISFNEKIELPSYETNMQ